MAEKQRKVGRPQSEYKARFFKVVSCGVIKWQCRYCEMQYGPNTGTANLKRHLITRHPECLNGSVLISTSSGELDNRGYGDTANIQSNLWVDQSTDLMPAPGPIIPRTTNESQFPPSQSSLLVPGQPPSIFSSFSGYNQNLTDLINSTACYGRPHPASNSWPPNCSNSSKDQWGHSNDQYPDSPQPQSTASASNSYPWQQHPAPSLQNHIAMVINNGNENGGLLLGTPEVRHQWPQHPTFNENNEVATSSQSQIQHFIIPNPCNGNGGLLQPTLDTGHLQSPPHYDSIVSSSPSWMKTEALDNNCGENSCRQGTTRDIGHLQWPVLYWSSRQENSLESTVTAAMRYADPPSNSQVELFSSGRKRKQSRDIDVAEVSGLDVFTRSAIETLIHEGFSKCEILEKMLTMTVCNPMYLHAFLNDTMHDFFAIVHPHFPDLSLSLVNDDLLRRKRESLKSLLKEFCDTRWSPLIFDVFVFPLVLGDHDAFAMVELVFLDKKGHRRSCLLDCVPLPEQFPAEMLCGIIATNLRAFEVDSKLSDCTMWGRKYEAANSVLKTKLECRRRGRADGAWEEEKKKQFFSVLRKTQEEQVYNLQIEVVQCLSCLDQLEDMLKNGILVKPVRGSCPNYGVDMTTILSELSSIFEPNLLQFDSSDDTLEWRLTPNSHMTERFLEIVRRKFHTLKRKMKKLSDLGGILKRTLNQISCDRKYAVYYIHKNQKNVNLLHIVPVTSYEDALKDIYHYLINFMELLKNPDLDGSDGISGLVADMDLIEIEDCPELSCNTDTLLEPKALIENILKIFQDWKTIFQQGVALSREYISLCNYFTGYKNHESNIQSRYAQEFCDVARSAPPHLSHEQWKKVAFLRAWSKFQSSYE